MQTPLESLFRYLAAVFVWQGKVSNKGREWSGSILAQDYNSAEGMMRTKIAKAWKDPAVKDLLFQSGAVVGKAEVDNWLKGSLVLKDPVSDIVHRYAMTKKYTSPEACLDQCKIASGRLYRFLRRLKLEAEVVKLKGPKGDMSKALPKWKKLTQDQWIHHVVQVGEECYDLTYRQFDPDAPYPLILSRQDVNRGWSEVHGEI